MRKGKVGTLLSARRVLSERRGWHQKVFPPVLSSEPGNCCYILTSSWFSCADYKHGMLGRGAPQERHSQDAQEQQWLIPELRGWAKHSAEKAASKRRATSKQGEGSSWAVDRGRERNAERSSSSPTTARTQFKPTSEGATDLPTAARSYLGVRLHLHPSDLAEKDGVGETPLSSKSSLSPERFDSNSTADL